MPFSFLPLALQAQPPLLHFANGVRVVHSVTFDKTTLEDWAELYNKTEIRQLGEQSRSLYLEGESLDSLIQSDAMQDAQFAIQFIAPMGNYLSIELTVGDQGRVQAGRRFERFAGTAWSRMAGFNGVTTQAAESLANGVFQILQSGNARMINPLRMLEHGLINSNPYLRIFMWVSALDGIYMGVKTANFIERLSKFLGATAPVFPAKDGVYFTRPTTVSDVAADLFSLRSEIAHGQEISEKFWRKSEDLRPLFPLSAYGPDSLRYLQLLEESALSLLKQTLHKIILSGSLGDFSDVGVWRQRMKML